jgi:hypothetical protein
MRPGILATWPLLRYLKFIYSEKATKFCEIFSLLLTECTVVKSKGKISQNLVAYLEYMNFNTYKIHKTILSECFLPFFLGCTPRAATTNTILILQGSHQFWWSGSHVAGSQKKSSCAVLGGLKAF